MYYDYYHTPFVWGFAGSILSILFWALVVVLVILVIRRLAGGRRHFHGACRYCEKGGDHALDILKERYAKGEIDKTEFEQKKKDLMF